MFTAEHTEYTALKVGCGVAHVSRRRLWADERGSVVRSVPSNSSFCSHPAVRRTYARAIKQLDDRANLGNCQLPAPQWAARLTRRTSTIQPAST